jgi:signal transduction histidine kinase
MGREPIEAEITASKAVIDPDHRLGAASAPGAVYVYTIHDVTQRKRSEEATRQAKEQAVANDRAKTEFLANMSHELRTPLNAIIGFSEMMSEEMLGPLGALQYVGYARDIHQSGAHLLGIIDDILDVSQIELGQFRFVEEAVDLVAAIDSAARLVSLRLREKEIRLEIEIDDGLPRLWADDRAVKQILLNLLTNAAKFTAAGGDVSIRARVGASGEMIVSVSDTGIGMPPEVLASATQAFYQAERATARSRDGLGLGLFIVQGLMKLHGGSLALESTAGVGTTVTLTFPPERSQPPSQG